MCSRFFGVFVAVATAVGVSSNGAWQSQHGAQEGPPGPQQTSRVDTLAEFIVERHGRGPAMILIPGLMSSGEVWDGAVAHYRDRYELHVLTLAGFAGVPPLQGDRFLERQRDAIIQYIRDRQLERPALVGHSLGGFLAFSIASAAPDLVGPVVAVDGVPFLTTLGDSTLTPARVRPQAEATAAMFAGLTAEQVALQARASGTAMVRDTQHVAMLSR